ncbi:MAG TPA: sulfotransferase [Candidatus Limnocylindria bacterium]|nr:sulfotransferase [Candidatus Limnocylindria bacterium]
MRPATALSSVRAGLRRTPLHTAWRWAASAVGARRERGALATVRTYCVFLGHARSGHSIVGALLDAHPQVVISDELDALRYIDLGFDARQVMYLSLAVSGRQAANQRRKAGQGGTVYSYHVPGQWQGRHRDLRVVGDSQAGWTVQRLARDPQLLERLRKVMAGRELRFIHVIRSPYDNISTMMIRGGRTFESAFDRYFANCESIGVLGERIGPGGLLRVRHEDVIVTPKESLSKACQFLGVTADAQYLEACASILYDSPSRSRSKITWTDEMRAAVEGRIAEFEFLSGYRFDDA